MNGEGGQECASGDCAERVIYLAKGGGGAQKCKGFYFRAD